MSVFFLNYYFFCSVLINNLLTFNNNSGEKMRPSLKVDDEIFFDFIDEKYKKFYDINNTDTIKKTLLHWSGSKKRQLSLFFRHHEEINTPLLYREEEPQNFSPFKLLCGFGTAAALAGAGSWMLWDPSQAMADIFKTQLIALLASFYVYFVFILEVFYFAVKTFCFIINIPMSLEVMILIGQMIYYSIYRTEADKQLTGKANIALFIVSILIGYAAEWPYASIDLNSAKGNSEKTFDIVSLIISLVTYWFGGLAVLMRFFPKIFSKKVDDTLKNYTSEEIKLLTIARSHIANKFQNKVNQVLLAFQQKPRDMTILVDIRDLHFKFHRNKSRKTLQNLFIGMGFYEKQPSDLNHTATWCQKAAKFFKKNLACNKTNLANKAETIKGSMIIFAAINMVINDIVTAGYATADIFASPYAKVIFGSLGGILTAAASGGFTWESIKNIVFTDSPNLAKMVHPKIYLVLAILITFIGAFSGGPSALEGIVGFNRLLKDLGCEQLLSWVPQLYEALGFIGGGLVNVPLTLNLAQRMMINWILLNSDDYGARATVQYVDSCNAATDGINEIKLGILDEQIRKEIFGPIADLGFPPEVEKFFDVTRDEMLEIPSHQSTLSFA